eukprot:CAMPEP_0171648294 /NCGR_PEP_ID=MMETSP0990-20121206/36023_1 /TAXON_ID=483369 /ORGANISM="non described non described, Strain CCMP2098" /LENGTH=146 /DNA_ID=CAMNT_0012225795 /DNA_START=77 /DNA_END=517 /DNA_ORIENTATION=-
MPAIDEGDNGGSTSSTAGAMVNFTQGENQVTKYKKDKTFRKKKGQADHILGRLAHAQEILSVTKQGVAVVSLAADRATSASIVSTAMAQSSINTVVQTKTQRIAELERINGELDHSKAFNNAEILRIRDEIIVINGTAPTTQLALA